MSAHQGLGTESNFKYKLTVCHIRMGTIKMSLGCVEHVLWPKALVCSHSPKTISEIETRGSGIFLLKVTFEVTLNCVEGIWEVRIKIGYFLRQTIKYGSI